MTDGSSGNPAMSFDLVRLWRKPRTPNPLITLVNPRLVILEGPLTGTTIRLEEGKKIVGREPPADVVIPDPSIEVEHAEIEVQGDRLLIRDVTGENSIMHGDTEAAEALLNDEDTFTVGRVYVRFETGQELPEFVAAFKDLIAQVKDELSRRIIGQDDVVEQLLSCVFAGGHCLVVGVPGLAKTLIVNTLGHVLDLTFKRVQFTPDLMPSDITGTNIINADPSGERRMQFVRGPIFTQLLLADEINRTPPKTQAALLESMQERQVTVGNETYELPAPFMVVATQNPIEQEGTYPLPEAQLDRFMYSVHIDYPTFAEEEEILRRTTAGELVPIKRILDATGILRFQRTVQQIEVSPFVISYVAKLVRSTRPRDEDAIEQTRDSLEWGAGPRAGQYLIWGAKAIAAMDGRLSISCDDVRRCAVPVLRHRIAPNFQTQAGGITTETIIAHLLDAVTEPEIAKYVEA